MNQNMKERPILFSGAMIRALLDGSKTQTRRVVKPQPVPMIVQSTILQWLGRVYQPDGLQVKSNMLVHCPYGQPGDRLWVRETHLNWWNLSDPGKERTFSHVAAYAADGYQLEPGEKWIPSIHMLRAASRILLEIVSVRIERLQDISEADATAEGVAEWARGACAADNPHGYTDVGYYSLLWESINGAGSWSANPWVWVIEFKRVLP